MTVIDALKWANETLKSHRDSDAGARLDSPMLDAEILLAHAVGEQKAWLFTHMDYDLKSHEEEGFRSMVARRLKHEPVAYITGRKWFYKRLFSVDASVLIPRPATETLVEEAMVVVKDTDPESTVFADIGTGSGAIAVTLAAETGLPGIATDVSETALATANRNAAAHDVADRIDFRLGDGLEPIVRIFRKMPEGSSVGHLILAANLPYLTDYQWQASQPEMREYEPRLALAAGTDGLDAYWKLFRELGRERDILPGRVTFLVEIDPRQREEALRLIRHDFPESHPRVVRDLEGHDRVIIGEI